MSTPDALFSPLVEHAIELAAQWHEGTYRKGSWREPAFEVPETASIEIPVMAHLTAVASIVQRAGWEDEAVAAAYLHDAIEDMNRHGQRLRRKQLREAVGPEVARLVAFVSEEKEDDDGNLRSWRERKEGYIAQLRRAPAAAVAISLADKLHNLWSMTQSLVNDESIFEDAPGRRALSAGPDAQLWFHRAVLDASESADDPRLVPMRTRLSKEIARFEEHARAAVDP